MVLITAEMSEAFPPAGNLALEVVSTAVVVASMGAALMAVVADIGDGVRVPINGIRRKFKNGGKYHAAEHFDFSST